MVANGDLAMQVQGLIGQYITLEESGLKNMVEKAIELNQKEAAGALTTTVVDDAFFVISKSARRSMSTLSVRTAQLLDFFDLKTLVDGMFPLPPSPMMGFGACYHCPLRAARSAFSCIYADTRFALSDVTNVIHSLLFLKKRQTACASW